jgi:predicted ester cyclase
MHSRREFTKLALAATLLSIDSSASGESSSPSNESVTYPYAKPDGVYPQPIFIRDALSLHFGSAKADKTRLFIGWDDDIVAYGMAPGPVNKGTLQQFYLGVFTAFPDFTLVNDSMIVAGNMGAHRYHAMGTHSGGPNPTGKRIMFRGQTIYRVNPQGRVDFRVSNHDHDFRESQIAFAATESREKTARSWSPDPYAREEQYGDPSKSFDPMRLPEGKLRETITALMQAASLGKRSSDYWSFYRFDAKIHGLVPANALEPRPVSQLKSEYGELWSAMPDLTYATNELIVCGPYAIQQNFAWGHHSGGSLGHKAADGRPIRLREQTIYRFDEDCKIAERWINHDAEYLAAQLLPG